MKVSVQYAESHLTEFVPTPADGDGNAGDGILSHDDVLSPQSTTKRGLWGAGKGEIWMADDWDSPETNGEMAHLFNDGPIFPDESGA